MSKATSGPPKSWMALGLSWWLLNPLHSRAQGLWGLAPRAPWHHVGPHLGSLLHPGHDERCPCHSLQKRLEPRRFLNWGIVNPYVWETFFCLSLSLGALLGEGWPRPRGSRRCHHTSSVTVSKPWGWLPSDQEKPKAFEASLFLNFPSLGKEETLGTWSPQSQWKPSLDREISLPSPSSLMPELLMMMEGPASERSESGHRFESWLHHFPVCVNLGISCFPRVLVFSNVKWGWSPLPCRNQMRKHIAFRDNSPWVSLQILQAEALMAFVLDNLLKGIW